jgi:tetratricopeptide (TPR) repeat protein
MQKPWLTFIAGFVLCGWLSPVYSQTAQTAAPSEPHPEQEGVVVEQFSTSIQFENDGTSTREVTARVRVQSEAGVKQFGVVAFQYQGGSQSVEIDYVRVRKPDGTVVATPQDYIQDLDSAITRDAPLYSDLREKHVAVKGLSPGDNLEYHVTWRTTKPLAPRQFWCTYQFIKVGIVLDEQLRVKIPRGRNVKVKSTSINPIVTQVGNYQEYDWKSSNLKNDTSQNEDNAVAVARGRIAPADVQVSSFETWDQVGKWYWGLQQDRIQPGPSVRAKAIDLTNGSTDTAASIRMLYDFVSKKFHYIGIDFGIGRYQPHAADDVLGNQYGDCKDKHTLLASLLQVAGIRAYPALISSTTLLDPDVPSPAQFDHVITVVPQGKNYLWLDSTAEVGPFGYLLPVLRDKQALVIPGDQAAVLVTTPADPPFASLQTFKIEAKLTDDGTLDAKVNISTRGDSEVVIRAAFREVPQAQWKDLTQQISYGMGFAGTVSDPVADSPEDTANPFHLSYNYNRKEYPDWSNHRITVPGLPFTMPVKQDDSKSTTPIWLGTPAEVESDAKVDFPKGFIPDVPVKVDIVRDYAEYHSSYREDKGALIAERRIIFKLHEVPTEELGNYKEFVKSVQDDVNRYIDSFSASAKMERTQAQVVAETINDARVKLPASDNIEAREMESKALAAGQNRNIPQAIEAMRNAVSADPKFARGWFSLGGFYMTGRQPDAAIDAYHKVIDSDPTQPVGYKMLALALTFMGTARRNEAIQAWKDFLKIAPGDRDGVSILGSLLVQQKLYKEAVPLLESAVKLQPSISSLRLLLARSYFRSGEEGKGLSLLEDSVRDDSDVATLNGVAHELADANQNLPDALKYAESAVRQAEEASQKIQLTGLTTDDLSVTRDLANYWDTLGWVHFRMGDHAKAESYIRAAWLLSQEGGIGNHLGQVYEREQKTELAMQTYALALGVPSSSISETDRSEVADRLSRLKPKPNTPSNRSSARTDTAGGDLSELRTTQLGQVFSETATAEFFLLVGPKAKIEDIKFISGEDKLKVMSKTVSAATIRDTFPDGSNGRLVRRAIVSCFPLSGCVMVLLTPDTVKSVN